METDDKLKDASLLRTAEIDEIIGRPPHWIIQWGISVFFIIIVLVLVLSYFIKYPETVSVPFKLISNKPSLPVSINESGTLIKIAVKENQSVHKNDTLLYWMRSNSTEQHVFISRLNGYINFISPLFNGQKVTKGQFLFYITQPGMVYYAVFQVNSASIRKVKPGQQVKLDFSAYPGTEYGYITGITDYISAVKMQWGFYMRAKLPYGLKTDSFKTIPFKDGLTGTAEIIISKKRLMRKLLSKVEL